MFSKLFRIVTKKSLATICKGRITRGSTLIAIIIKITATHLLVTGAAGLY